MTPLPAGEWSGFYEYDNGTKHRQRFTLTVDGPALKGAGVDGIGEFDVAGESADGGLLRWTKTYTNAKLVFPELPDMPKLPTIDLRGSKVEYRGEWNGERIRGTWKQDNSSGAFELRPGLGHEPPPEATRPAFRGMLHFWKGDVELFIPIDGPRTIFVGKGERGLTVAHIQPAEVHALFFFEGAQMCIEAKTEKVMVNGVDIGKERRPVGPNDTIECGPLRFQIKLD